MRVPGPSSHTTVRTVPYTAVRAVTGRRRTSSSSDTSATSRSTTALIRSVAFGDGVPLLAGVLDALAAVQSGFRPPPPAARSGISTLLVASLSLIEIRALLHDCSFGPSTGSIGLLRPLLTSGISSSRLTTRVALRQDARSPRVMCSHLHAYARCIYACAFRTGTGL